MKLFRILVGMLVVVQVGGAQTSDLAKEHTLLTTDCKAIRGHAKRIVEEASAAELNTSVAAAHLGEVIKSLSSMEKRLQGTKKLLNADQAKLVSAEYSALEKLCTRLKGMCEKLEQELAKQNPDRFVVRKLAFDIRNEMTSGSEIHDKLKSKLGVK